MSSDEFYLEGIRIMEEEQVLGAAQMATAEERAATDEEQREASGM